MGLPDSFLRSIFPCVLSKFIFGIHIYLHTFPSIYSIYARHLSSWGQTSQNPKTFDISWFLIFFLCFSLNCTSNHFSTAESWEKGEDCEWPGWHWFRTNSYEVSLIFHWHHILRLTSYPSNFLRYDSTGMFHWTPARAIEECIIVSVHIVNGYENLESSRWIL